MSVVPARQAGSPAERYRAAFEQRRLASDALSALRRAAFDRFAALGFPSQRDEEWKYTNLRRLETRTFAPAGNSTLVDTQQSGWIERAGMRVVLVNGHAMPGLSTSNAQPPGVTLLTLKQWAEHAPDEVASFLSQSQLDHAAAFVQLNLAFFEDGIVLNVADGARMDQPLYIVHHWNESGAQQMSHPRIIVRAGRDSRCAIIEQYVGSPHVEAFTNAVTTFEIGAGAAVQHYRLQEESARTFHIGTVAARLQRDSRYSLHDVALGATLGRTTVVTRLEGSGSHVSLQGLLAPMQTQHLDSHTRIDHAVPHTTSDENYRGIAAGKGRGVFNGKVIVRAGAQKTDARQSSRNLLLSPGAEIDAKPELEIYANDVKCSHGATTGQLDATALFYLRSRGLSESEARTLLIRAFAESIVTTIAHEPVHDHLERLLGERYASVTP